MKIHFFPSSDYAYKNITEPKPAKQFIPEWYKKITQKNGINIKSCIPFLDSLSHGYIQSTFQDIYVKENENGVSLSTDGENLIFSVRKTPEASITADFHQIEFAWLRHWSVKLPNGYSGLILHPLNRNDLPFVTLSGTVDFDNFYHVKVGMIPFYIKKGFSGTIPKGTPMFQIIPIKRDNWEHVKEKQHNFAIDPVITGGYKRMFWSRKQFD
jgi:hypothetical protein